MENSTLVFYVNGREIRDDQVDPETTLLCYIRNELGLKGTKLGCGEGGCGACTVMVSKWDEEIERIKHFAVNSCLAPVVSMHHCAVTTTEGIGSVRNKVNVLQERLNLFHGSQCGFCTPGMIMSMYALLRNNEMPTSQDIGVCLQGNLCRCTGYRPIMAAFETFACGRGDKCCMKVKGEIENVAGKETTGRGFDYFRPSYDSSQEVIFPPTLLKLLQTDRKDSLKFIGKRLSWYRPVNLMEAASMKAKFANARIVAGNTSLGYEMIVDGIFSSPLICVSEINEMNTVSVEEKGVTIGASCSMTKVGEFLRQTISKMSGHGVQTYHAILNMLHLYAGTQIRNVATIGGHIMNASPISQLNPIFVVSGTRLKFFSDHFGWKEIVMGEKFFTEAHPALLESDEILISVHIPFTSENDVIDAYKQSKRKINDGAIVTSAMRVTFQNGTSEVESFSAAFGGMDAVTKVPEINVRSMVGRMWDEELMQDVCKWLQDGTVLSADDPGGKIEYRSYLVIGFFFKFFHHVLTMLISHGVPRRNVVSLDEEINRGLSRENDTVRGTQTWQEVSASKPPHDTIGWPIPHLSGLKHTTGEAQYIGDIPAFKDEAHLVPVYSTRAYAKILNVDVSLALVANGVIAYVDRNDVPGENEVAGEQVFADGEVTRFGQVIGAIIADTQHHAMVAARLVKVEYENLHPLIITIEDAIKHASYHGSVQKLKLGSITDGFRNCDHVIDGEISVGGQEHFYMETQTCMAIPKNEDGEMEMWSATQNLSILQQVTASCLGVDQNKVTVRSKRVGGAFGGKETHCCFISSPAAVAAHKLGRPIRCMLSRQDDMKITGGRHPFLGKYKVGFNKDGKITTLYEEMYSNAGNTRDLSRVVMQIALTNCQNCYSIPNIEVRGYVCRTNLPTNTAMRGFGNPQAMIIAEDMIVRVASHLSKSADEIREINMYKEGDATHYGVTIENFVTKQCWQECMKKCDFDQTKREIDAFNSEHRWRKRGISLVPSRFLVSFGSGIHLNQAGALVLVYTDGSVRLSHAGIEMGQGLHTKMIQVAGRSLGIPVSLIHTSENSTAAVPNTSTTSASMGSDMNGMAVKLACEKILRRLEPVRKANPDLRWPELVRKAYREKINLSATGFYKMDDVYGTYDPENGVIEGNLFKYMTHAAAVTQVEIDVLTGHHVVLRTDLVVDVGNSLNPSIDIGQIEGSFVQGYGHVTLEEPLYSHCGQVLTVGPRSYKIPTLADVPKEFNVHLFKSRVASDTIYSSKAVGEPAVMLGSAVFFAIKDAISYARKDADLEGSFRLNCPASAERIRLACGDNLSKHVHLR